jgi:hypothetical protein
MNDQEQSIEIAIDFQLGIYSAVQPTSLPKGGYLLKKNAYMNKVGSNAKRFGSAPVTSAALAATIQYLTEYVTSLGSSLLAVSGTTLYKYDGASTLTPQTMTNAFASANVYSVAFTDVNLVSILFIADSDDLKKYTGSAVITIVPAPDDASPAPANGMAAINLLNPIYTWVHSGHLFVSDGKDVAYYSKQFVFDYFPVTYYERWVNNNDYITGPGVSFGDVCVIPMRRRWAVLTGTDFSNFSGNKFLNTINGNISPRAIQKLTYPDGSQTVAYLSDDGMYEIYDTGFIDSSGSGTRNLATRPLMKDKVDFSSYGFTEAEKIAANAYFDSITNMYILCIKRGAINYAFAYDVRNREWTGLWENIKAESSIRFNNVLYYAGATKLLHKYDDTLATDYDDLARTTGTIVAWRCALDVIMLEDSGYPSYLDYVIINAKSFLTTSTIDLTVVGTSDTYVYLNAVQSSYGVWDISDWDSCVIANLDFTSIVGAPSRTVVKKRALFFQIILENDRDELVELYKIVLKGRISGN